MRALVLAVVMVLLTGNSYSATQRGTVYPEGFRDDFGRFGVGLSVNDVVDESRTCEYSHAETAGGESGRRARPIRVYTWYPAVAEAGAEPMTLGRYIDLAGSDFPGSRSTDVVPLALPIVRALSEEQLGPMKALTTNACRDAKPAKGRFPLILLGQGLYYENPITHFALCEYFASHGFVVATCPLMGTESPLVRLTVRDLETQVRDLEFALELARALPSVDADRIGMIGFDMGGMAAQILQMKNSRLGAVMTMDAGIVFRHFSGLPGTHPSYDLQRVTSPWMHITQKRFMEPYRQDLERSVWGNVSDDRYLVLFDGVIHASFTSYGLLDIPSPLPFYWGEDGFRNVPVYAAVCGVGLTFMNARLNGSQEDGERLQEQVSGQDTDRVYTIEFRKGTAPELTFDQFLNEINRGNLAAAAAQARRCRENDPAWRFYPEDAVNDLGYRFLYAVNRPDIALDILKLNVDMNPQSGNVYDSYGEALAVLGRNDEAIAAYKKSLELDSENQNAKAMLDRLSGGQSE